MKSKHFKYGEKLVCIDASYPTNELLELNKIYTFNHTDSYGAINLDEIPVFVFNKNRFISFSESRKLKLKKLNEINSI